MPEQKSTYIYGRDVRIQILCPPLPHEDRPTLYELDGCGLSINHIKEYKDPELEDMISFHIHGEFALEVTNREAESYMSSKLREQAAFSKAFDDEVKYLKRREGLRVIRFRKGKGETNGRK